MLTPKQDQFRMANIAPAQGDWNKVALPEALHGVRVQMQAELGEKINYLNDEEFTLALAEGAEKHYQAQASAIIEGSNLPKKEMKNYQGLLKQNRLLLGRERGSQAYNLLFKPEDLAHIDEPLNYEFFSPSLQGTELYLERLLDDQAAGHVIKQLKTARFAPVPGSLQIRDGKVSLKAFHEKYGQNEVDVDTKASGSAPFDMKFTDPAGNEKHVSETQLDTEYGNISDSAPSAVTSSQATAFGLMPSGKNKEAEQAANVQMAVSAAALAADQARRAEMARAAHTLMQNSDRLSNTENVMANKAALQQRVARDQATISKRKKRELELQEEAKAYRAKAKTTQQKDPAKKKAKNPGTRFVAGMAAGGGALAAGGGGLIGYLTLFT